MNQCDDIAQLASVVGVIERRIQIDTDVFTCQSRSSSFDATLALVLIAQLQKTLRVTQEREEAMKGPPDL